MRAAILSRRTALLAVRRMIPSTSPIASTSDTPLSSRRMACEAVSAASDSRYSSRRVALASRSIAGYDPPVSELAAQHQFAVSGTLEFLEDHLVHAGAGVDECSGDDRQRPTALRWIDVAGAPEEALGLLERTRVEAPGQRPTGAVLDHVVGTCEASNRIEDDDHVLAHLGSAAGALQRDLGYLHVALGRIVEARGHHFTVATEPPSRSLLRDARRPAV